MGSFSEWIEDHIYVPIIAGVLVLFVIGIISYCCFCRRKRYKGSYYVYKRLEHEAGLAEQMNRERESQLTVIRGEHLLCCNLTCKQNGIRKVIHYFQDSAFMNCQYYLRSQNSYKNLVQLKELGSRIDKHWFQVMDVQTNQECLMTSLPPSPAMSLPFNASTAKTLQDLFTLLKHPHIFPIRRVNFAIEQNLILCFQPICPKGSLKDYIYQSRYSDNWYDKYSRRQRGLPVQSIKVFGKQVLNGLLYLEEKGFPPHGNIQSGNVIFDDGICRLTGYENKFLANTSRLYNMVKRKLKQENKDALDTISFGHLLYEMAFGYELTSAHPEPQHLVTHQSTEMIDILNFIFGNETGIYPSIKEIEAHDFFIKVNLKELQRYNPVKVQMTDQMKTVLKAIKKGKSIKATKMTSAKKKKSRSPMPNGNGDMSSFPTTPVPSSSTTINNGGPSSSVPPPPPPPPPTSPSAPSSSSGGPPPPPPPPSSSAPAPGPSGAGRTALLGDIRKGMSLKKTKTNDRSAPKV